MHEHSIMNNLIQTILQIAAQQNAKRIISIRIQLGALTHMSPEHFKEHFDEVACNTIAQDARLDIECLTDIYHPQAQQIIIKSLEIDDEC